MQLGQGLLALTMKRSSFNRSFAISPYATHELWLLVCGKSYCFNRSFAISPYATAGACFYSTRFCEFQSLIRDKPLCNCECGAAQTGIFHGFNRSFAISPYATPMAMAR